MLSALAIVIVLAWRSGVLTRWDGLALLALYPVFVTAVIVL